MIGNQDVWIRGRRQKTGRESWGKGWNEGTGVGKGAWGRGQGPGVYNPGSRNVKLEGKGKISGFVGVFVYVNGYRAMLRLYMVGTPDSASGNRYEHSALS